MSTPRTVSTSSAPPRARLPGGFADREAGEIARTDRVLDTVRAVFGSYGYQTLATPFLEYSDALGKFLPDADRPNEGVFSLKDGDGQWLSLRYDLTAPLARHVAEHAKTLHLPLRSLRFGHLFRNEKPDPGRFREFIQCDADIVGAAGPQADAEMCMMAADALGALGIRRGDYMVRVGTRAILDALMKQIGLAGAAHAAQRLTVLRAIDKRDKIGLAGIADLLGRGRRDASGDFTPGAALDKKAQDAVLALAGLTEGQCAAVEDADTALPAALAALADDAEASRGLDQLRQIIALCRAAGYTREQIAIDLGIVRGLGYYTGPVFEAELTCEVTGEKGKPVRIGAVGGGGRYDGLVDRFQPKTGGQKTGRFAATGISLGISRLAVALAGYRGAGPVSTSAGPVIVLVLDRARMADYVRLAAKLRRTGIAVELYGGTSSMKAQMKYADRRGAPCVIIQGADEAASDSVSIKDMAQGLSLSARIGDNASWRAARPAQTTVKTADMEQAVRTIIAAQAEAAQKAGT